MGKPIDFREVAAHLACPQGEMGVVVAQNMNRSNGDMTRRAIDRLEVSDGEAVLEIGPGNGALASYVTDQARDVRYTGADMSETMVEEASRLNRLAIDGGRMRFVLTDGETLPFANDSFDKVVTVNTLYFWANPAVQLAEIGRVLRPAGAFCLSIASKAFMQTLPFTPYGFRLYTKGEAIRLLEENGFAVSLVDVGKYETSSTAGQVLLREELVILAGKRG